MQLFFVKKLLRMRLEQNPVIAYKEAERDLKTQ